MEDPTRYLWLFLSLEFGLGVDKDPIRRSLQHEF